MEKDLILAHDLGTTGNKATLFNTSGEIVASAFHGYGTEYAHIGWAEQNPEDWWEAFQHTSRKLVSERKIDPHRIAAVSFSGQMMGCLCVNREGKPLRNSIIWADQRGIAEAALLSERVGEEKVYQITGHRVSPTYSLAKLLWIRKHEKEVFQKTHKVLHAKDFLNFRLTGQFVTDYSDASSMNLFDIRKKDWSDEITEAMEISKDLLPRLCPSTHVSGEISRRMADELGLVPGIPVVVGGGDGPCAAVGAGVVAEGVAYNYIGSSSWIALANPDPIYDPERRTFNFFHLDPHMVTPTGTMQSAGGSYQWLRNTLCSAEVETAGRLGGSAYDLMNQQAAKQPGGCKRLALSPLPDGGTKPPLESGSQGRLPWTHQYSRARGHNPRGSGRGDFQPAHHS